MQNTNETKFENTVSNQTALAPGMYYEKGMLDSTSVNASFIELENGVVLNRLLCSVCSDNMRIIENKLDFVTDRKRLNQQILGEELAKILKWPLLLSLKIKYIFSKTLQIELEQIFKQIEYKLIHRNCIYSLEETYFLSLTKVLTLWDNEVAILIMEGYKDFPDSEIKKVFLKCLCELSIRVPVFLI